MSNRVANATEKIPTASSGPRQLSTMPSPARLSNMGEELPLILAVRGDCLRRQPMEAVPNAIELPQAAAQFLRNFRPRFHCRLRTPPPTARKLIQIFSIGAVAANCQPFALCQSRKQAEVRCTQRQAHFALPLQPACQREPFIFGT